MPKVKLSIEKALVIQSLLKAGLTHQSIADMFDVTRQTITKINTGMKDKEAHSGRWKHVNETELNVRDAYLPCELQDVLKSLSNEQAGILIKKLLKS